MEKQIAHGKIDNLSNEQDTSSPSSPSHAGWKTVSSYLFFFTTLLEDELIKDGSKLLMDLLHLVDVAGNFVHRFHGNCGQTAQFLQLDATDLTTFEPCPTS